MKPNRNIIIVVPVVAGIVLAPLAGSVKAIELANDLSDVGRGFIKGMSSPTSSTASTAAAAANSGITYVGISDGGEVELLPWKVVDNRRPVAEFRPLGIVNAWTEYGDRYEVDGSRLPKMTLYGPLD